MDEKNLHISSLIVPASFCHTKWCIWSEIGIHNLINSFFKEWISPYVKYFLPRVVPSVDSSDDECCCVESWLESGVWEPGMGLFLRLSSLRGWLGLGVRTLSLGQGDRGIPLSSLKETWTDFTLVEQCLLSVNDRTQLVNCLLKSLSKTVYCNLFHCLT